MFGAWSNMLVVFAGIVATGLAIQMMDDFLDQEYDQCLGKKTIALRIGRATLPYTLLLFAVGASLAREEALPLFLGSYVVGMAHDWKEKMPTRLPGYGEMAGAFLLSLLLSGSLLALWGVTVMATVQLLDDLFDYHRDARSGQRNAVLRFGLVETTLLLLLFFLLSLLFNVSGTVMVLLAVPLVYLLLDVWGGWPQK